MTNHIVGTVGVGRATAQKLEGLGWGLFFIWIGIASLLNLGWGVDEKLCDSDGTVALFEMARRMPLIVTI